MTIPAERLNAGAQILVRGKISFSRLAKVIDGQELATRVAQEKARGRIYPTDVPHTTVSVVDAQLMPANPAALTIDEQFVQEKIYTVGSGENQGKMAYGVDNKGTILPTVLELDPENPGAYRQLVLERDLASGVDVILVLQVYKPKNYAKHGIGIQQVVLQEPVRYFASAGADTAALAARGIIVSGPIRTVDGAQSPAGDTAAAAAAFQSEADMSQFVPANTGVDANGLAAPIPGAQGIAPVPPAQQFPVTPAPAAPVQQVPPVAAPVQQVAPVAPAAPVQQAAPVAPVQGETQEQVIARLTQQLEEQRQAQGASGGASAFDTAPAVAPADITPWGIPGQAPAAYQG